MPVFGNFSSICFQTSFSFLRIFFRSAGNVIQQIKKVSPYISRHFHFIHSPVAIVMSMNTEPPLKASQINAWHGRKKSLHSRFSIVQIHSQNTCCLVDLNCFIMAL